MTEHSDSLRHALPTHPGPVHKPRAVVVSCILSELPTVSSALRLAKRWRWSIHHIHRAKEAPQTRMGSPGTFVISKPFVH
jgi:hypothetical protein